MAHGSPYYDSQKNPAESNTSRTVCQKPSSNRKELEHEASLLESHACGGMWTVHRLLGCGNTFEEAYQDGTLCKLCKVDVDSEEHRTYQCEATQRDLRRLYREEKFGAVAAQKHVEKAKEDLASERRFECLWL